MIKESDIKVGMTLINDGTGNINIYDNTTATDKVILTIKPTEVIGQVVQLINGADGLVVYFSSDAIKAAESLFEKAEWFFLQWIPGEVNVGSARFSEIQANVSETQIAKQNGAIQTASDNGVSLSNSVKKVVNEVEDVAAAAIPWTTILLFGAGWYLFTHSKGTQRKISKAKIKWKK